MLLLCFRVTVQVTLNENKTPFHHHSHVPTTAPTPAKSFKHPQSWGEKKKSVCLQFDQFISQGTLIPTCTNTPAGTSDRARTSGWLRAILS